MKRLFRFSVLVAAIFFLFCGSAMAITYTYSDDTNSWPGYAPFTSDSIGSPQIASIAVTINDSTRNLESVVLNMTERYLFDSLFINTGGDGKPYEAWDFYVYDSTYGSDGATLYTVGTSYTYLPTTYPYRPGHPVGFTSGITADTQGRLSSVTGTFTDTTLTYIFNPGIYMNSDFTIGYAPTCANDVILTPEPASLLLLGLGLGLIGVLGMKRKLRR